MSEIRTQAVGVTDVGMRRARNEDALVVRDDVQLYCVADGMGGHQDGQWASRQIKEALERLAFSQDFEANLRMIADAVHGANAAIAARGEKAGAQMGTTAAILYCFESRFAVFWAGDSRIYLFREGELQRLTTDHTQVQEMIDTGLITAEEARTHPNRHILSRAVGASPRLTLDAIVDDIEPGDRFLLCSDGLTGVVTDAEIGEHLRRPSLKEAAYGLLDVTLARGAPDNVTIIAIACEPA